MSNSTKLSARDRIATLLDDNSFVEIGTLVTKRNTDFNLLAKEAPSDGVVTGYGVINGAPVYVYCQDASVLAGTIGEMHARKIANVYDLAMKCGAPIIGIIDCAGLRLEEATDALEGLGEIMSRQALASGLIPQIMAVLGNCGGGLSVAAGMCDFVLASKGGKLFVNAPNAVKDNNETKCDSASAAFKAECGEIDYVGEDDVDVLNAVRELVSLIPSCNADEAVAAECNDDLNRETPELTGVIADGAKAAAVLADDGKFFEIKKDFAKQMVTGFIQLDGATVGVVANRNAVLGDDGKAVEKFDAVLTVDGCRKAMTFVNFCDAFNIPVLSLTNVEGYCTCMCGEKKLATAAAKLASAFANATVPKVNLITGKAIGSAYTVMNSKAMGADMVFALDGAEVGPMKADLAAQIVAADGNKADKNNAKAAIEAQLSVLNAAKRGYVDSVIDASVARKNVVYAFEMLYLKDEGRPDKKHGTI